MQVVIPSAIKGKSLEITEGRLALYGRGAEAILWTYILFVCLDSELAAAR